MGKKRKRRSTKDRAPSRDVTRAQGVGRIVRKARRGIKQYLLRRRRARATRKKSINRRTTYVLVASLLALLGIFALSISYLSPDVPKRVKMLRLDELSALAKGKRLASMTFLDYDKALTGRYTAEAVVPDGNEEGLSEDGTETQPGSGPPGGEEASSGSGNDGQTDTPEVQAGTATAEDPELALAPDGEGRFYVENFENDAFTAVLVELAAEAGARIEIDPQSTKKSLQIVATFLLPLMILANLFAVLFTASKGGGAGIGQIINFGSIGKGSRRKKGATGAVNFDMVAGADEAVAELKEVVDYLKDPERYEEIGATPPKGVLLFGPPGCGKTLLAKAVAGEAGVPFFSVAGAQFVESLVGVGAARVRDLFQRVRAVAPAIVFIDELDAAGRKRGTGGGGGGSDEREQTLNQILVEMDGFEVSAGIVIIGATNRPDILDPALLRPGRFDRHVTIDQPDQIGRQEILELHASNKPVSPDVEWSYVARRTPGFSGADLANVVNEAALLTIREGKIEIEISELEEAVQRVLAGPKKRGRVLTSEERKRAAFHEAGHAIVAAATGRMDTVHRVSILARGRGVGVTALQQESDAVILTRSNLVARLVTAMGGIACEEMIFGEPSTGAENDLEQATDLTRDMIGRFGMGTRRRRLLSKESEAFLGDEPLLGQISGQTHHEMENEIDRLLEEAEGEAIRVLLQFRNVLDVLAGHLETDETLEGPDLENILAMVRPEVSLFVGLGDDSGGNGKPRAIENFLGADG